MAGYKNYGLQYVDPQRIKIDPPLEPDWDSTKGDGGGTPRETIDRCLSHLDGVRGRIDAGATADDFVRMRESDDPQEKALGESHSMFYGGNPVKVSRDGEDFITDGGRHRAQAAQEAGVSQLPVEYHGPADDPEFAGRPDNAARLPANGERAAGEDEMGRHGEYFQTAEGHLADPPEVTEASTPRDSPSPQDNGQSDTASPATSASDAPPAANEADGVQADGSAADRDEMMGDGDSQSQAESGEDSMDGAEDAPARPEGEEGEAAERQGMG
jgi:hypothetical protein